MLSALFFSFILIRFAFSVGKAKRGARKISCDWSDAQHSE